jgi:hypothetical protein
MAVPEQMLIVAERLGNLREDVVFLGGMVRELLVTDPVVPGKRFTKDVDVIVQIASRVEHARFSEEIRRLGFTEDMSEDAPICRFVLKGAFQGETLPVDFMPLDEAILGFSNKWYPSAFEHALAFDTPVGPIRLIDAPHFIATKLESFSGRGQGDYAHHDIEDVVVVVDGRPELAQEVKGSPAPIRQYIAAFIQALLADRQFREALPWHLPPDAIGQSRLAMLEGRLRELCEVEVTEGSP